jgi:hypothetical protein
MDGGVAGAAWPHGPVAEFSGAQGWCRLAQLRRATSWGARGAGLEDGTGD